MDWSAIVAGTGIGLLLGFATGMSTSPLVATVISTILALLGGFLGFKETSQGAIDQAATLRGRQFGVGAFGIACVIGLGMGVFVRAHDLLAVTPSAEFARWKDAQFDDTTARALVAFRIAGIMPANAKLSAPVSTPHSGILFGADVDVCQKLTPSGLGGYTNLRNAFASQPKGWAEMARLADSIGAKHQYRVLTLTWEIACEH